MSPPLRRPRSLSFAPLAQGVPIGLAGVINGVIEVSFGLTLGAIVFSGPLSDHLPVGLGLGLFSTIAVAAVIALTSSLRGMIGSVQDVSAILLALVLDTVLAEAAPTEVLPTAIAAIALTTLSLGLVSLLLGCFNLGSVIRFVPFPVIGGFLGGTGWFLVLGSLLLMTGLPSLPEPAVLLQPLILVQWLPGLIFAVTHRLLLTRFCHPLLLPSLIFGALPLFYLGLGLSGTSLAQAGDLGLLLGPFAGDGRWHPLQITTMTGARWDLILGHWQSIGVLLAVTLMAMLLNISSLEVVLGEEMNLNQELRATGLANLVSGLGGGLAGFQGLGSSALGYGAIRGRSRWVGILVALCGALALVFGADIVAQAPRLVLGGLGLSLGISFLLEWLWQARSKLPWMDYGIVVVITVTMATLGVLPAVGLGLAISIVTFLINYSRINVVRYRLSGQTQSSSVNRPPNQQRALQAMGQQIQILRLQGYLFFGTANQLVAQVKQPMQALEPDMPQFILLDFEQVIGMDSSSAYSFIKLKQAAQPPLRLVLTHLRPDFKDLLTRQGCLEPEDPVYHLEPDLDHGLQWCEEQLLGTLSWRRRRYVPLPLHLQKLFTDPDQVPVFMEYLEKRQLPAEAMVFDQGQPATQLFFLESGQIQTFSTLPGGEPLPERTYQPGTILGATAFFSETPYGVAAKTQQPSLVYGLSRDRWQAMITDHPKAAAIFQQTIIAQISENLLRTTASLKSLLG
ncbi:MAG TPA: SLC26A/SulP transporter family protein [Leptolyngbyaceae cyanobacterium M65_K2018_010]|nr:SLC26A/SulP transporter family protein [Leptolyngbyaceae cyanobacterium M65_K2018_010]